MRAKLRMVTVFLAISLFAWGWTVVLTARIELLSGLYFKNTMGTFYWGLYLLIAGSAMLVSYVIVAIRSSLYGSQDFKLTVGTISLWITWFLGAFNSSLTYHMPSYPPNSGPLPEPGLVVITWDVLVTLNLIISLLLLWLGPVPNRRKSLLASA